MSTTVNQTTQSNYGICHETINLEEERHLYVCDKGRIDDKKDTVEVQSNTKKKKFNPAPAKAKDNNEQHIKFKPAPAKAKDNDYNNTTTNPPPPSNSNSSPQTNSANDEYSKKSGAELLAAFRNGDEKLLKALNENPALMQKLIDQMHMEERHIELISNYNKSKDDALKTIIHNMK